MRLFSPSRLSPGKITRHRSETPALGLHLIEASKSVLNVAIFSPIVSQCAWAPLGLVWAFDCAITVVWAAASIACCKAWTELS